MLDEQDELWKDVTGYHGRYKISSQGRVSDQKNIIKAQHLRRDYYSVILYYKNIWRNYTVHRLVALHFLENPSNLPQVNHKDGNKLNNHISNLEWCSASHNTLHAIKNNLRHTAVGEMYRRSSLTNETIQLIRSLHGIVTVLELSHMFRVNTSTINKIIFRKTWKHVQ